MYRTDFWTLWEKARVGCWENSIETSILSRVKQITSPGWMCETSAQGWCTGKTQRYRVEWEMGGEIGMGNTCNSMADSYQCMTKPTTVLLSNSKRINWNWVVTVLFRCNPQADCSPMLPNVFNPAHCVSSTALPWALQASELETPITEDNCNSWGVVQRK